MGKSTLKLLTNITAFFSEIFGDIDKLSYLCQKISKENDYGSKRQIFGS